MVLIRKIREEDYEAAGMIWREVLDVPVSDEDLAQIYRKMSAAGWHAAYALRM